MRFACGVCHCPAVENLPLTRVNCESHAVRNTGTACKMRQIVARQFAAFPNACSPARIPTIEKIPVLLFGVGASMSQTASSRRDAKGASTRSG
ncbi:MAG: hypothetical protein ACRD5J_16060 [Nitrososphaeraceae archaeon]